MRIKGHAVSPRTRRTVRVQLVTPNFSAKVFTPVLCEKCSFVFY